MENTPPSAYRVKGGFTNAGILPRPFRHGGLVHYMGASAGGQSINGGEGPNFDRLYDKLKVLSLLLTLLW